MKEYHVRITLQASADMESIYEYISGKLRAPDTALRQYDRIASEIESLRLFPERYHLLDSEPERTLGMRRMLVDSYSVIYTVNEPDVTVLRVFFSASDWTEKLRRGISF